MKVFLIGFMGCGKTTMAKKLSLKMGYQLIDLDQEIELSIGESIGSYFEANGEQAFRELESKSLKRFNYPDDCVVATGGGTPCYYDNMDWMNSSGITVYLEMPSIALAQRLYNGRAKRPLLKDLSEDQVQNFIESKMVERDPFYQKAKIKVSGLNLSADDLKSRLLP